MTSETPWVLCLIAGKFCTFRSDIIQNNFESTLMVSNGWPDTTQHIPPNPPARKFFTPEVLLACFFWVSPTAISCSAILFLLVLLVSGKLSELQRGVETGIDTCQPKPCPYTTFLFPLVYWHWRHKCFWYLNLQKKSLFRQPICLLLDQ